MGLISWVSKAFGIYALGFKSEKISKLAQKYNFHFWRVLFYSPFSLKFYFARYFPYSIC